MTERTHFRCHAYGLLSVAVCKGNRELRLSGAGGAGGAGKLRPLSCRECMQCAAVDAGREPSLTTLAALQRGVQAPAPRKATAALPADSPMADVGRRAEAPLRPKPAPRPARAPRAKVQRSAHKSTPAPVARDFPPGNGAGPAPPAPVPSRRAWGSVRAGALHALRDGPATPLQVAQHVGCMRQTAAKVLQRLAATGRVVSAGGGAYALPAPPAKRASARVARLLKDLAARKIGLPEAVRRARGALKAAGRKVPPDTWRTT
jgi:hypothetical protein